MASRRRERLLALALAMLVCVAIWLARSKSSTDRAAEAPSAAASLNESEVPTDARSQRLAVESPRAIAADPIQPPTEEPPPPPTATASNRDLEALDDLELLVVDDRQLPVMDAEVTIGGLRADALGGAWYRYRGDLPIERTDAHGRAHLSYLRWATSDYRSVAVDLRVRHPDFAPFRDSVFQIGPGEHVVKLRRGATVVVSAWIASHSGIVSDVEILVERDAGLQADAWRHERDGRWETTQLAPGKHVIWLRHESAALGVYDSDIVDFELATNESKELSLELHPEERLEGVLDDVVPRPIVDGHVMVSIQTVSRGIGMPTLNRKWEVAVRPDGTFAFDRLPRGKGQIFALCSGWVSKRTRADSAEDAGIYFAGNREPGDEAREIERMGDRAFQWPRVAVPVANAPFVIAMERTATLEITVKLEDGSPLADARASASPNIQLIGGGASIVPWRSWFALTDSSGTARIEDVPPTPELWLHASREGFQMRRGDRVSPPTVAALSGETARAEIVLETKSK